MNEQRHLDTKMDKSKSSEKEEKIEEKQQAETKKVPIEKCCVLGTPGCTADKITSFDSFL